MLYDTTIHSESNPSRLSTIHKQITDFSLQTRRQALINGLLPLIKYLITAYLSHAVDFKM